MLPLCLLRKSYTPVRYGARPVSSAIESQRAHAAPRVEQLEGVRVDAASPPNRLVDERARIVTAGKRATIVGGLGGDVPSAGGDVEGAIAGAPACVCILPF